MSEQKDRLQKVIAQAGITSRRKAEQYIIDGRVKVNNKLITSLGTKVTDKDEVAVDDIPINRETPVYYVLYKPRGCISAVSDDKGRKTVIDIMEDVPERIFPIGRLDFNSSGLLLLTNDGDFANLLMHPRYEIKKVYVVKVNGVPTQQELDKLQKGIKDKGETLRVLRSEIKTIDKKKQTSIIEFTLQEGKNRHIRRMMECLGYPVNKLTRERYGHLKLQGLQPGKYRELTRQEIHQFRQLAKNNTSR